MPLHICILNVCMHVRHFLHAPESLNHDFLGFHIHKASERECARWKVGNQQRDEHAEKVKKREMERWIT